MDAFKKAQHSELDILVLSSFCTKKTKLEFKSTINKKFNIYLPTNYSAPGGALAYIINRKAAIKILEYNTPIKDTADAWQTYINSLNLTVGYIKPNLFKQINFGSTIDYTNKTELLKNLTPNWIRSIRRFFINRKLNKNISYR